mmetsp:Transcript_33952/g.90010  ORF Transcript_33952/g.90010 Transcript_33952/m.90010 type:complete len:102 (+) Transcript_33952:263-568(+)
MYFFHQGVAQACEMKTSNTSHCLDRPYSDLCCSGKKSQGEVFHNRPNPWSTTETGAPRRISGRIPMLPTLRTRAELRVLVSPCLVSEYSPVLALGDAGSEP